MYMETLTTTLQQRALSVSIVRTWPIILLFILPFYYPILKNCQESKTTKVCSTTGALHDISWMNGKYDSQPMAHNQLIDAEGHQGQFVSDHWWLPHKCDLCTLKHFEKEVMTVLASSCALQNCVAHTRRLDHNERIWCTFCAIYIHPTVLFFKSWWKVCNLRILPLQPISHQRFYRDSICDPLSRKLSITSQKSPAQKQSCHFLILTHWQIRGKREETRKAVSNCALWNRPWRLVSHTFSPWLSMCSARGVQNNSHCWWKTRWRMDWRTDWATIIALHNIHAWYCDQSVADGRYGACVEHVGGKMRNIPPPQSFPTDASTKRGFKTITASSCTL